MFMDFKKTQIGPSRNNRILTVSCTYYHSVNVYRLGLVEMKGRASEAKRVACAKGNGEKNMGLLWLRLGCLGQ